jgi:hypothetical protein
MHEDPLRGQNGRGALEIETFLDPEMATSEASAIWMYFTKENILDKIFNKSEMYIPMHVHCTL